MKYRNELICQNAKRITQLTPIVNELINAIDLGTSNIYDRAETLEFVVALRDVLGQIDSDLSSLETLLSDLSD